MKKFMAFSALVCMLAACNNSSTTTEEPANPTNVQNVNGNIPDTSGGSVLNTPQPIDSSRLKDSLHR
jgi:hypothetical protein